MRFTSASDATGRLTVGICAPAALDSRQRAAMYEVFARHYDCVSRTQFERDLDEKDRVIVLTTPADAIVGFSTQKVLRAVVDGRHVHAIFSGDTVIDRDHWGEQALCRGWCRYARMVLEREPETPLYWFLISKGYRTYLYLPLFFREFYPRPENPTPAWAQRILTAFAREKFAEHYDPATGLIVFSRSHGQLTEELAGVPHHRLNDPHVRFFIERNPDYRHGTELACVAEISLANLSSFGRRLFQGACSTAECDGRQRAGRRLRQVARAHAEGRGAGGAKPSGLGMAGGAPRARPPERSGAGVPASDGDGGAGGAKPPGLEG